MKPQFRISQVYFDRTVYASGRGVGRGKMAELWSKNPKANADADRSGVYVFALRAGRGIKPLYVGMTAKQSLRKRIQQHMRAGGKKGTKSFYTKVKKGKGVVFLVARIGRGRPSPKAIDDLELRAINFAIARNQNLRNGRRIRTSIQSILGFGRGKPSAAVASFRKALGL